MHAGTIPDGASTSEKGIDGLPSSVLPAVEPELQPWDHYFDDLQDICLEERGGTFRHDSLYTVTLQLENDKYLTDSSSRTFVHPLKERLKIQKLHQ